MKSILEYQNEYWSNYDVINEAFSCKLLQELRDQQNNKIKIDKEFNGKQTDSWRKRELYPTFKRLMGDRSIKWDEIKDEDCKEYSKDDPEAIKIAKRMAANRANHINGMIVLINNYEVKVDEDTYHPKYTGILISNSWGCIFLSLISRWAWKGKRDEDPKPSTIEEFLSNKFIFIDLDKYSANQKQHDRNQAKSGTFNLLNNEELRQTEYDAIIERNRERYKKYIAKVKADKESNDGMADKVTEYVNKILAVTSKMSNNPIKYAKYEYEVQGLIGLIDGKATYVSPSRNNNYKGYWAGKHGLMYLYREYISKKLSLAKGDSYDFEKQSYDAAKKALEDLFKYIDGAIAKFID